MSPNDKCCNFAHFSQKGNFPKGDGAKSRKGRAWTIESHNFVTLNVMSPFLPEGKLPQKGGAYAKMGLTWRLNRTVS